MILVIDGNSILNRAYYGIRPLTTRDGLFTNAVYGFLSVLESMRSELSPDGIAVGFDVSGGTFRHKLFADYKAGRKGMPEELAMQLPWAKEVLSALGCAVIELPGYEADDILGTFARVCEQRGEPCVLATGDRDSLQLVDDRVQVRLARTAMGRAETTVYDVAKIKEEYGVSPAALIDVKALMGDSSDNIPGVAGIGQKTACALIARFGSLDGVYQNLDSPEIKPGARVKLAEGRASAYLSQELGTICREAPLTADIAAIKALRPDRAKLRELLVRLEFFKFITKYGLDAPNAAELAPENSAAAEDTAQKPLRAVDAAELAEAVGRGETLSLLLSFEDDVAQAAAGEAWCEGNIEQFGRFLSDAGVPKNIHNSKAVYKALLRRRTVLSEGVFDPMLAAYLLNPLASAYGPDRLCTEYGCESAENEPGGAVRGLQTLCGKLSAAVKEAGMERLLADVELPLAGVLARMELAGFAVNRTGLEDFGRVVAADAETLRGEIYELAGGEFNVNSPKQLGAVLFEGLQLPHARKTKSGYSTDAEVLESLAPYHPIVEKILEYRKLTKLSSTYCEGLLKVIGEDGRIHTSFNQTETRTGRISSLEPNLQNIPVRTELGSRLRDFFIAREGWVLVDADYSQIELRVLAAVSGDEKMIDAFNGGLDIHTRTASEVFGLPPEKITPALRSRAKAVNFGIVYGIGAFSLSRDIGVSMREADQYIQNYLAVYPKVKIYLDKTVEDAKKNGYVTTLFGRRRPLPELAMAKANLRSFGERAAKNTAIQGTAADIIKIAMVRADRQLREAGLEARLILQVHDELIVEAPEAEAERAAAILREAMEGAAELAVKLSVDVHCGKTWLEAKG